MWYYLIIALQGFCIYHAIKNRSPYYWIFIIFFLSLIGCIIYIITQVYNKRDAEKITSEITHIINPTKNIRDLEKQLEFSESYQNRVNLADAYLENKDYNNAIKHFKEALDGNFQNDFYVIKNMMEAYHQMEDYKNVVNYGEQIVSHPEFAKSRTQFLYGMALEKEGQIKKAEENLKAIDIRFSFYNERLIYAKFLIDVDKKEEAREILEALISEGQHMTKPNKRLYSNTITEASKMIKAL
ncbi:TRAFs-binding domain-containing protein [Hyunsoonleella rubra]|uniref:TRAFs-binding domain-containing protein n=1 Tax=Hyunsoonleella rubra TaxID=1737062 RepID=A0ABW5T8B1_9FLAO